MEVQRSVSIALVATTMLALGVVGLDAREIESPVSIRIDVPDGVVPGVELTLTGSIELQANAPRLVVRFESDGPLVIDAQSIAVGPLFAGETVPFEVAVTFTKHGNAVIHAWAEVADELGVPLFANRGSLYARLRPEGSLFGRAGFMSLERLAIEVELGAGKVSDEQADQALAELHRMVPKLSATPPTVRRFTPRERRLNRLIGLAGRGAAVTAGNDRAIRLDDKVKVQGHVRWQDENGDWHPVWGGGVIVAASGRPAPTFTDVAGNFSAEVDPGDIQLLYELRNLWVTVRGLDQGYSALSELYEDVPGGTVLNVSFEFARGVPANDANSVFQATTWIAGYAASDLIGRVPRVAVVWPNGQESSYYRRDTIYVEEPDRFDWDTVHHEYGHFVADEFDIDFNPGGPHRAGDCLAATRGRKSEGVRLAWAEGWPTYFAITGQIEMQMADLEVPRVGDVWYQDLEDSAVIFRRLLPPYCLMLKPGTPPQSRTRNLVSCASRYCGSRTGRVLLR